MNEEYDVLVTFNYDGNDYALYTDNTYNDLGEFNVYGAKIGKEGRLEEADDVDISDVFNNILEEYNAKIINGEI